MGVCNAYFLNFLNVCIYCHKCTKINVNTLIILLMKIISLRRLNEMAQTRLNCRKPRGFSTTRVRHIPPAPHLRRGCDVTTHWSFVLRVSTLDALSAPQHENPCPLRAPSVMVIYSYMVRIRVTWYRENVFRHTYAYIILNFNHKMYKENNDMIE